MPIILKENKCVHCKTWDEFVTANKHVNKYSLRDIDCSVWYTYKENTVLYKDGYSNIKFSINKGHTVYSYNDFMQNKNTKPLQKTYTQKEVDVIIAETRHKTIDEIIERLETLNSKGSFNIANNCLVYYRCKICGKFKSKSGKCKSCKK